MSTLVSHPNPAPAWKQEVNRRLADHKNRKGLSIVEPEAPSSAAQTASTRAAQAAARVAARYAKAPSYSEMQAAEARTAVRAAEIATLVALDAQAAANVALAGLEAASCEVAKPEADRPRIVRPEPVIAPAEQTIAEQIATSAPQVSSESQLPEIRQEVQIHFREPEPPVIAPRRGEGGLRVNSRRSEPQPEFVAFDIPVEDWWRPAPPGRDLESENIAEVEPDQPIHANLIEFPRELVAAHKARPRLAEGSNVAVSDPVGQLSIFEVDPGAIAVAEEAPAAPAPFEWSGIELDPEPLEELEPEVEPVRVATTTLQLAPFSRRLLAVVVDGQLIAGASLAAALVLAANMDQLPALKIIETGAPVAVVVMGLLYFTLFSALAGATPGMRYAGVSLCTFDNRCPTLTQRCGRLGAMFLSVLPLGLGVAWAIFDEDHLSWHDRLSRTYQRRS